MEVIKKYKKDVILIFSIIMFVLFSIYILKPSIVVSNSMLPVYRVGDMTYVSKITPYEKIKEGNVIEYYQEDGQGVTHRVKAITDKGLIVQGDNNQKPDKEYVTKENYIGKVVFKIPFAGKIIIFLKKHLVTICLIMYIIYVFGGMEKKKKKGNSD